MGPFFLRSSFASFVFLIAASFLAVLLSASSVVSEFGICSGFGGGSSCTSAGSVGYSGHNILGSRIFGSQFSLSDTARKNWPIHTSQGYGGSADGLPQNEGTPSSSVLSSEEETAGCAM